MLFLTSLFWVLGFLRAKLLNRLGIIYRVFIKDETLSPTLHNMKPIWSCSFQWLVLLFFLSGKSTMEAFFRLLDYLMSHLLTFLRKKSNLRWNFSNVPIFVINDLNISIEFDCKRRISKLFVVWCGYLSQKLSRWILRDHVCKVILHWMGWSWWG